MWWGVWGPVWLGNAHRWSSWAYFRRPFSCSGQFCTGQPWTRSKNIDKSRKTARFESKNPRNSKKFKENHRFESKIDVFVQKWTNPEMPKGTPTQVGMPKIHPHKPKDTPTQAATDPLRGSNQEWAQVDVNNPWPLVIFCIVSRHGLRWLRAASRGREAPVAGGEKIAETWDPNFCFEKMDF